MSCIFCKIISGEIPSSKVYEDDKVLAFNDINPVEPYHVPENEMDIIAHIHNVMNKIARDKGFDKTGFRIINNCGHDGGQEVKHIHYHVLAGKKLPLYEAMEK